MANKKNEKDKRSGGKKTRRFALIALLLLLMLLMLLYVADKGFGLGIFGGKAGNPGDDITSVADTSSLNDSLARARADSIARADSLSRADSLARAADSIARADSLAKAYADSIARYGYDSDGFDRAGYDRDGFDRDGFNRRGFDRDGYDRDGFDRHGFGRDGFDREGYDRNGFGRDGFNREGYGRDGFGRDGFDREGYDRDGFDRDGYDREGYDRDGYDRDGFDRRGRNRDGRDRAQIDSLARLDSIAKAKADSLAMIAEIARADSAARAVDPCARDTLAPWVYADPSGGLHRKAVEVKLVANKKCKIEWSFDGVKDWKVYGGQPIKISKASTLYYRAVDSCGKTMDVRSKRYEFDLSGSISRCPQDMEHVKIGNSELCVDRYEWPNRAGVVPTAFVSLYQAMDSCFSVRKRLCTSDEWTAACAGPEKWRYLYGDSYESNTCASRDTAAQRSGSRPECRGYYEIFDMTGNLAEWTSTPAPQNRAFNNVMGGYWASGNQTRCTDARYSYFPQNRHNPVGFRCCKDIGPQTGGARGGERK